MDVVGRIMGTEKRYDSKQLAIGTKIEMEHTKFDFVAEQIAKNHLDESPNYYVELVKMEKRLKKR